MIDQLSLKVVSKNIFCKLSDRSDGGESGGVAAVGAGAVGGVFGDDDGGDSAYFGGALAIHSLA